MKVINSNGQVLQSNAGGGGGGGSVNFSAGTQSSDLASIVFSNSNGVTFGLSNGTITASAVGGGGGSLNVSAGTTSQNLTNVVFSNSNGISFGLNGSTVTGTVQTNYLTTAMASNRGSDFVQAAAAFAGTSASGTIASNGISVSIGPYITTGALSNHSHGVSFTSGSVGFQTLSFTNSNGISFNSGTQGIFGSHNAITTGRASTDGVGLATAQTNVTWTVNSAGLSLNAGGYAGTGFTSTTTAGTDVKGTHNTAGLSMAVPAFLTTAMQSNAATISNIKVSAGTTSNNMSALTFDNAGGITFGLNGSVITAQAPAGAPSPVNFSAGTTSNNLGSVIFANSNGISFGLNTGASSQSITASHNGLTTARASNDGVGLATAQSNVTWTVNSAGISLNANGYAGTTTGFTGANISVSMTHDTLGLAISASVAAGGGGNTADYFVNAPMFVNSQTMTVGQSTSHILPIILSEPLSFDFVRMIASGSVIAASTTAATTGNTQFSCGYTKSHNFVIYSRGNGANSASLQSYYSTQIVENFSHNVSAAANSTQFSYSQRYSLPCFSGTTGFTHDYSSSQVSLNFNSASATMLSALKWLEFKVGTTLSAGEWWMMYGQSSTSSSQFTSAGWRDIVTYNFLGVSQATIQIGPLGSATQNTKGVNWGAGSFSTAGGGTTASLNFTNITTSASNNIAYVQLMRSN